MTDSTEMEVNLGAVCCYIMTESGSINYITFLKKDDK